MSKNAPLGNWVRFAVSFFVAWNLAAATAATSENFAAIQFAPSHDRQANQDRLSRLAGQARERGARFVVAPELALSGPLAAESLSTPAGEQAAAADYLFCKTLARDLKVWFVTGLPKKDGEKGYHLQIVLFSPAGEVAHLSNKVMVSHDEAGQIVRGDFRDVQDTIDIDGLRIGILSGGDIRTGVPRLADRGADTILIAAGWSNAEADEAGALCREFATKFAVNLVVADRLSHGGVYFNNGTVNLSGKPGVIGASLNRNRTVTRLNVLGLPHSVPGPSYRASTPDVVELGRKLFFDANLSSTGQVSCSSCHVPEKSFTNGKLRGIGVFGRETKRNVPSLLNVSFRPLLQWDGYASTLENFAKYPISSVNEMNFHYVDKVSAYLSDRPEYVALFKSVMGVDKIEFDDVSFALASYQRTLLSGNSPFDRYFYGHEQTALPKDAARGLALFQGKAGCAGCHSIGEHHALFLDFKYHVTGAGFNAASGTFDDIGLGSISTGEQTGQFQTPSLRNVAETAPYMHDGSLATLEDVVQFYDRGGTKSPRLDPAMQPLGLTVREKADLVAFLKSLTGEQTYNRPPRILSSKASQR